MIMLNETRCGLCEATGVRIHRPYGSFYRPEDDRCNACLEPEQRSWYVPCIKDHDGSVWGLTSIPQIRLNQWYVLPDKDFQVESLHPNGVWGLRLDKCPFCGNIHVTREMYATTQNYVTCVSCGATGPKMQGYEKAIKAWNRRKS